MLNAIAGYDPLDATTVRTPVDDYTRSCCAAIDAGCASAFRAPTSSITSTTSVAAAVEEAIATLRRLGADVRDVEVPGVAEGVGALFGLVLAEAQEIHAHALRTRPADFGADVRATADGSAARQALH